MVENSRILTKMYIFSMTGIDAQVKAIFAVHLQSSSVKDKRLESKNVLLTIKDKKGTYK